MVGCGRASEQSRTHQIQDEIERAMAIESPKLRQREGHQDQDRARHLEHEVDHADGPRDPGFRILPVMGFLMIGTS